MYFSFNRSSTVIIFSVVTLVLFIATPLPSDWDTWEEEKLDNFISDNYWEPFEYWDVNDVYELIDQLTIDVMNLMGLEMSRD